MASLISSKVLWVRAFFNIFLLCTFTVSKLMASFIAICCEDMPRAMSESI